MSVPGVWGLGCGSRLAAREKSDAVRHPQLQGGECAGCVGSRV